MRAIVATADRDVSSWLQGVLTSAGLSVAVVHDATAESPELHGSELLIADKAAAASIGSVGPFRRMLLVPRGAAVDVAGALGAGFMDLVVVPSPEDEILGRVGRALDSLLTPVRGATATEQKTRASELKTIVTRVCGALQRVGPEGRATAHQLSHGMLSVFLLLIDAHETAERAAPGHSKRAAALVHAMAARMGFAAAEASWLELAARLQDIGMLPLRLPLTAQAPLSRELRRTLVDHARTSADILSPLGPWGLPVAAVRRHHERVDGSGYPDRLPVADIGLDAQILGAADVYEALTSRRPWRPAETRERALEAMDTAGGFAADVLAVLREVVSTSQPRGAALVELEAVVRV